MRTTTRTRIADNISTYLPDMSSLSRDKFATQRSDERMLKGQEGRFPFWRGQIYLIALISSKSKPNFQSHYESSTQISF